VSTGRLDLRGDRIDRLGRLEGRLRLHRRERVAAGHAVPDARLVVRAAPGADDTGGNDGRGRRHGRDRNGAYADRRSGRRHTRAEALAALLAEDQVARIVAPTRSADHEGDGNSAVGLASRRLSGKSDHGVEVPSVRVPHFEQDIQPEELREPVAARVARRVREAAEVDRSIRERGAHDGVA